jgi:hypothetical protein
MGKSLYLLYPQIRAITLAAPYYLSDRAERVRVCKFQDTGVSYKSHEYEYEYEEATKDE